MDTPNMLRGEFYSTSKTQKCPNFKQCPLCKMCRNYNRYNAMCVACEDRKRPKRVCTCTPKNLTNLNRVQEAIKGPLFQPDKAKQGDIMVADTSKLEAWDEIVAGLNFQPKEG